MQAFDGLENPIARAEGVGGGILPTVEGGRGAVLGQMADKLLEQGAESWGWGRDDPGDFFRFCNGFRGVSSRLSSGCPHTQLQVGQIHNGPYDDIYGVPCLWSALPRPYTSPHPNLTGKVAFRQVRKS